MKLLNKSFDSVRRWYEILSTEDEWFWKSCSSHTTVEADNVGQPTQYLSAADAGHGYQGYRWGWNWGFHSLLMSVIVMQYCLILLTLSFVSQYSTWVYKQLFQFLFLQLCDMSVLSVEESCLSRYVSCVSDQLFDTCSEQKSLVKHVLLSVTGYRGQSFGKQYHLLVGSPKKYRT